MKIPTATSTISNTCGGPSDKAGPRGPSGGPTAQPASIGEMQKLAMAIPRMESTGSRRDLRGISDFSWLAQCGRTGPASLFRKRHANPANHEEQRLSCHRLGEISTE